jgi:coenzyme F420-reducing hydrogenase alpha subunit
MQAGGFWLPSLLPGRYAVAAVQAGDAQLESMPPTDPESLSRLMRTATMISVAAGETATLHLALRK